MKWEDVPEFIQFETDPCNWISVKWDYQEEETERRHNRHFEPGKHPTQVKLFELAKTYDLSTMGYRAIGEKVGIPHPQLIKHHLLQLYKYGLLK